MFQNLKLRTKLVAIAVPPLFVLAIVAAYSVLLSRRTTVSADVLIDDIRTLGVVALASVLLSALTVVVIGRTITDPLESAARAARELAEDRLPALLETIKNPGAEAPSFEPLSGGSKNDEVAHLISSLNAVQDGIAGLAVAQRNVVREGLTELVVNLARRNQSLLDRQIEVIDALESSEEDPDRLEDLFGLDHLATRMRRNAESLLVVAGAESVRRRGGPVAIADVLRVAMSEIEDYRHVKLTSVEDAQIGAQAAVDLAHLFSEVLENATQFSPPDSPVEVTGVTHPDGSYLISCVDHGIGMTTEQLAHANEVLANPPELGLGLTRSLGFIVVGRLARRLGVNIELMHTASGGITAIAEVPAAVLAGRELPSHDRGRPSDELTAPQTEPSPTNDVTSMPAPPAPSPSLSRAKFDMPDEEPWTPPAMPQRGTTPVGTGQPAQPPMPEPAARPEPAAMPSVPGAPPMPAAPTPVAAQAPQSDALARLLGLGTSNFDSTPEDVPPPVAPSESSSMIFGRPAARSPVAPEANDEPWTTPTFDPTALEVSAETVAVGGRTSKLEDAIPTGESFDSGMESLLQPEAERTSSGLVKRDRSQNHAPVSEGRPVAASVRNPEEIRSMLARYRSGLKGKPLADLATPPMPTDFPQSANAAPESVSFDAFDKPRNDTPFNDTPLNDDASGDNTDDASAYGAGAFDAGAFDTSFDGTTAENHFGDNSFGDNSFDPNAFQQDFENNGEPS